VSLRLFSTLTNAFSKKRDHLQDAYCAHFACYTPDWRGQGNVQRPAFGRSICSHAWSGIFDNLPRLNFSILAGEPQHGRLHNPF
jgi:hypothetical protein